MQTAVLPNHFQASYKLLMMREGILLIMGHTLESVDKCEYLGFELSCRGSLHSQICFHYTTKDIKVHLMNEFLK